MLCTDSFTNRRDLSVRAFLNLESDLFSRQVQVFSLQRREKDCKAGREAGSEADRPEISEFLALNEAKVQLVPETTCPTSSFATSNSADCYVHAYSVA